MSNPYTLVGWRDGLSPYIYPGLVQMDNGLATVDDLVRSSGPLYAYDEGVKPSNSATTNTTNLNAAAVKAKAQARKLILPPGTINLNGQITIDDIIVEGQGHDKTYLNYASSLGTNVTAILMNETNTWAAQLRDLTLSGPGGHSLGTAGHTTHGIRMTNSMKIQGVRVAGFNKGVIINTTSGHCSVISCLLRNNFYNLYFDNPGAGNGDCLVFESALDGPFMASVGVTEAQTLAGHQFIRTHLGWGPYGIYQEAGSTATGFMINNHFIDSHFEAIGNGAIFTEKYANGGEQGNFVANRIDGVGFSWAAGTKIAARNKNYAVTVGNTSRSNYIRSGLNPFVNGDIGAYYIHNNSSVWFIDDSAAESGGGSFTINSGFSDRFRFIPADAPSLGWTEAFLTGATNNTTRTIQSDYLGPINAIRLAVTPVTDGGLAGPFTILASVTSSNPTTRLSDIVFKLKASGTTTSPLSFTWRVD